MRGLQPHRHTSPRICAMDSLETVCVASDAVEIVEPETPVVEKCEDEKKVALQSTEEYAYVERQHFTSEAFKIEIGNVPKYFGFGECKKLLKNKLKLNPHKIKQVPHLNKVYVTFKNEEDKNKALEKLNMFEYKSFVLTVKNAKPKSDAMAMKRPSNGQDGESDSKRMKPDDKDDNMSPSEMLMASVNKWHDIPYKVQIARKQSLIKEFLCTLRQRLGKLDLDNEVFVWIMKHKNTADGMCCPLHPIIPSPVETKYRNKSEFTVGMNSTGLKTVGNRLGKYRDQTCAVEEATPLIILPDEMKQVASKFQEYVRNSDKEPYNPQSYEGHWRQLTVRTSLSGEALAIVITCEKDENSPDRSEVEKEKKDLKAQAESGCLAGTVSTLLYQSVPTHRRSGTDIAPPEVLFGKGYITEKLLGLEFSISAEAFFQCNTLAAEVLYSTIGTMLKSGDSYGKSEVKDEENQNEVAMATEDNTVPDKKPDTILFDVCCGTGTIGLTLASHVKHVVGIEMCEQAVEDAKKNAEINGITNAEFHCGKAEDLLPALVKKFQRDSSNEIVAIVDPPRPGLHFKVIQCLRKCPILHRIIYVSCNPNSAATNFIDLCRPKSKRMPGLPFLPLFAQPFDLFPQTPHCELVVALKRITGKPKQTNTKIVGVEREQNVEGNLQGEEKVAEDAAPTLIQYE